MYCDFDNAVQSRLTAVNPFQNPLSEFQLTLRLRGWILMKIYDEVTTGRWERVKKNYKGVLGVKERSLVEAKQNKTKQNKTKGEGLKGER